MKTLLFLALLMTIGLACHPHIVKPNARESINASIRDANRLGIGTSFKKGVVRNDVVLDWCRNGSGGVLLEIPNGSIKEVGKDSIYVSSCYMDVTEVCNLHYRSFLQWNAIVYSTMPQVYESLLPDTSVWLEHFPEEAIGGLLKEYYFRNAAFDYYPVVGVSWKQAQAYALWRTNRINEAILIDRAHINADFEGQQGENHFDSYNYLNRMYEAEPGEKPMIDPITREERSVVASDEILLPNYRLPTTSELKQAAKHRKSYEENKALRVFKKKVLAHEKKHPKPAFYDHEQYNLPSSIIRDQEEGEAPYHLNDKIEEWTQQHYNTNDLYNKSHYEGKDATGKPTYYTPIWIMESEVLQLDTNSWHRATHIRLDTAITNKFANQHYINNKTSYKSFRCVLPNLW
ncbi:MAG: SUMF1/EgtB/PvdO family nonheme iron enzyme [Aureispira sp.]